MALYREGKAAMAADGTVTGTGTKWQSSLSLIRPGATIMFLSSPIQMAVVNKVVSDTEIKAITTNGAVVASSDYAILLSDSLTVDGLAQDVAETLRYYQSQETQIADAVDFFKNFDFEALQSLADQVRADSEAADASAAAAAASEGAAKTSETNSKASEQAANSAKNDAQTAKNQTESLYNQAVDLVAGVQAPDKLPGTSTGTSSWMKIANLKRTSGSFAFAQFFIGGGNDYGNANLPVDLFSISSRGLPSTINSSNVDANFTQVSLQPNFGNLTTRLKIGVVQLEDDSFDVYLYVKTRYAPPLWINRINIQPGSNLITGPIIDRTGYAWITTEPSGIVYNNPIDYLKSNDGTIPRTNVANTFSQPQAISVPGGNATLTLNGATIRANNANAIVYSLPTGGPGMYFRPDGDTNSAKQVVFDPANFTVTGLNASFSNAVTMSSTLRVNGSSNLRGGVDVTASQKLPLKETTATTGIGVNFIGDNATECSFGIENTAGGSAVFHNYARGASNSVTKNNQLLGGYGSRPWLGSDYTEHSNAALHFLGAGDASGTNHGGWIRLLVTPKGKTISDRVPAFRLSDNGDLWLVPDGVMHPDLGLVRSIETLNSAVPTFNAPTNQDGRGLKLVGSPAPEINMIAPRAGLTSAPAIRAMWCDGDLSGTSRSVGATQAGSSFYVGASGHDSQKFDSMRVAISFSAVQGWGTNNTPTDISFETTPAGSAGRRAAWRIGAGGAFAPATDNSFDIGGASVRVKQVYAVNGTINTSDARLKNDVRMMSDPETEAAKAIAKEIGFWTWKEQADMNDVREHCGLTVQRAMEIMESFGLEPFKYGFICHDEWEEQTVVSEYGSLNEDGTENPIYKTIPAGDRYSFRLEELNLFIAKGFEARLSALEDKLGM
ncbi:tail fiber protein [Klebsiella phage vB_KpnS-K7]|nr:tail fiber protein [Klebsiella phage vB_KpnS-K7]